MKRMMAMWLCLVPIVAAHAQTQVDQAEVLRMGDLVQHVDGIRSDGVAGFVEAMGTPASDADKWFISVLTTKDCAACQKLKEDWTTNPWLRALADPNDPQKSWAHFNVYLREDQSQSFRFENIHVTAYPTVLVQPPRSKKYGDPTTVVFQAAYGGDPEQLARDITAAIRLYVSKLEASQPAQHAAHRQLEEAMGVDPPWQPAPKVETPPKVKPVFPDGRPLIPPSPGPPDSTTQPTGTWGLAGTAAATSIATLLLAFGIPSILRAIRQWRIDSGQRPILSDEQFQTLVQALSDALRGPAANATSDRSDASGSPPGT